MVEQNEFPVLEYIYKNLEIGKPTRINFKAIRNAVKLSNEETDKILNGLESKRYIDQYVAALDTNDFILVLREEGANAYLTVV